jgi:hypothetical protein
MRKLRNVPPVSRGRRQRYRKCVLMMQSAPACAPMCLATEKAPAMPSTGLVLLNTSSSTTSAARPDGSALSASRLRLARCISASNNDSCPLASGTLMWLLT